MDRFTVISGQIYGIIERITGLVPSLVVFFLLMNAQNKALVVKSNALIEAMADMGLQEMRFLAFAASQLPHDLKPEKGKPYDMEIDVLALANTFNITGKNAYREVKALGDKLMRKIIEFDTDEGYEVAVGLISKRTYHHGEGRLWFRFDEDLLPHLMGLTERFTKYRLKDVYQFSRPSTWRVYELLRSYKDIGKRAIELEELRWKLGLADKYPRPIDLRKRVIDPAVEEISATSDMLVQYEQHKRGRNIVAFTFYMAPRAVDREDLVRGYGKTQRALAAAAPDVSERLKSLGVKKPMAVKLAQSFQTEARKKILEQRLKALESNWQEHGEPKNKAGYVVSAVKGIMLDLEEKQLPLV